MCVIERYIKKIVLASLLTLPISTVTTSVNARNFNVFNDQNIVNGLYDNVGDSFYLYGTNYDQNFNNLRNLYDSSQIYDSGQQNNFESLKLKDSLGDWQQENSLNILNQVSNFGRNYEQLLNQDNYGQINSFDKLASFQGKFPIGAIPISQHIDVKTPVPVISIKHVPVTVSEPYQVNIPYPILVPVLTPYPIEVPVNKPVAVPIIEEIKIPIEKVVPYPVIKNVPYPVIKNVPYTVVKEVTINVSQPYPVEVPVLKTVIHESKGEDVFLNDHSNSEYNGYDEYNSNDFNGDYDYGIVTQNQDNQRSKDRNKIQDEYYSQSRRKQNKLHNKNEKANVKYIRNKPSSKNHAGKFDNKEKNQNIRLVNYKQVEKYGKGENSW